MNDGGGGLDTSAQVGNNNHHKKKRQGARNVRGNCELRGCKRQQWRHLRFSHWPRPKLLIGPSNVSSSVLRHRADFSSRALQEMNDLVVIKSQLFRWMMDHLPPSCHHANLSALQGGGDSEIHLVDVSFVLIDSICSQRSLRMRLQLCEYNYL